MDASSTSFFRYIKLKEASARTPPDQIRNDVLLIYVLPPANEALRRSSLPCSDLFLLFLQRNAIFIRTAYLFLTLSCPPVSGNTPFLQGFSSLT